MLHNPSNKTAIDQMVKLITWSAKPVFAKLKAAQFCFNIQDNFFNNNSGVLV